MSIYLKNFLRFLMVIAIQVLLLNAINLRWGIGAYSGAPPFIPYLYPILILLLPVNTPVSVMLLAGFFTGLTMDTFMNTGGMHAAACVLMAYARKPILGILLPNKLEEYKNMEPSVKMMNWSPFITYSFILFLVHHFFFFLIVVWSFTNWGYLLLKLLATLITSVLFVVIFSLLFFNKKK